MGGIRIEPCQELANAVVAQAAKDYLSKLRLLKCHPEDAKAKQETMELERFFHSNWYGMLTDVDPDYLISRLKKFAEK